MPVSRRLYLLAIPFLSIIPLLRAQTLPASPPATTPAAAPMVTDAPPQTVLQRTGIVEDEHGKPVAGALVRHMIDTTTSGPDGRFTLAFPEWKNDHTAMEGNYIAASPDGSLLAFVNINTRKRADDPEPLRLILRPAKEFTVNVANATGAPVFGATVSATLDDAVLGYAHSNFLGVAVIRYPADVPQLEQIVAAKAYLGIDMANFDSIGAQPAAGLLNGNFPGPLNLVLSGARPVKFHIIDGHQQSLTGVSIVPQFIYMPGDKRLAANTMEPSPFNLFTETTDAQGNATCAILPAKIDHKTVFSIYKTGYGEKRAVFDPAVDQDQFTIMLLAPVHFLTRVHDASGHPIAGATLHINGQYSPSSGNYVEEHTSVTTADGTFAFDGDPNRYYTFVAQKYIANQGYFTSAISAQVILVNSPPITTDLTLQPARRIFGQLTAGPDKTPLAHFRIELSMKNDSYLRLPADQQLLPGDPSHFAAPVIVDFGFTDDEGRYEFHALSGSYTIQAKAWARVDGSTNGVANFSQPKSDFEVTTEPDREVNLHADQMPKVLR